MQAVVFGIQSEMQLSVNSPAYANSVVAVYMESWKYRVTHTYMIDYFMPLEAHSGSSQKQIDT